MMFIRTDLITAVNAELARREVAEQAYRKQRQEFLDHARNYWALNSRPALRAIADRLDDVLSADQVFGRDDSRKLEADARAIMRAHGGSLNYSGGGMLDDLAYRTPGDSEVVGGVRSPHHPQYRVSTESLKGLLALLALLADEKVSSSALGSAGFRDWSWLPRGIEAAALGETELA